MLLCKIAKTLQDDTVKNLQYVYRHKYRHKYRRKYRHKYRHDESSPGRQKTYNFDFGLVHNRTDGKIDTTLIVWMEKRGGSVVTAAVNHDAVASNEFRALLQRLRMGPPWHESRCFCVHVGLYRLLT